MKVLEIMTRKIVTCSPDDPVLNVTPSLKDHHITGLPVVSGDPQQQRVVGVVSYTDVITKFLCPYVREGHLIGDAETLEAVRISDIMNRNVIAVSPFETIERAAEVMVEHNINRLPVLENDKLVGIVSKGDIVKALVHH